MDLSSELWLLVETARQAQISKMMSPSSSSSANPLPRNPAITAVTSTAEEQQTTTSLLSTSQTLSDAVASALATAAAHVHAVVVALDAATPSSTAHLHNSLLLSDAELLSVGSSLTTFTETLAKVNTVTAAQTAAAAASTADAALKYDLESAPFGTGLVGHLLHAVSIQQQRVAATRLRVALAKEELALFKAEMYLYGRCGVLSCSEAVAAQLARHGSSSPPSSSGVTGATGLRDAATHGRPSPSPSPAALHRSSPTTSTSRPSRSGFGATFRMVDGVMQMTAQTVKAAGSHADSALQVALTGSQAAARQFFNVGGVASARGGVHREASAWPFAADKNGATHVSPATAGVSSIELPALLRDDLSREEEARLEEQSQALLHVQHEATAQDAKAVEASIRELSQLTSLMNEQVVQQTEQFSLLVRNTEAAHSNLQKSVTEVKKPLASFWNPTRQLIALLWACMVVLLAVNSAAR